MSSFASASILTKDEAEVRFKQVSNIQYRLDFHFQATRKDFDAKASIRFNFNSNVSENLFLELSQAQIHDLRINGQAFEANKIYDGERIQVQNRNLKSGPNLIEVNYTRAYVNNGNGLHRFEDLVDHKVYLFNHFEAYYAHLAFPCFDQPDLKAVFTVTAAAPKDWEVITSAPVLSKKTKDAEQTWEFAPSPKMSTYVLNLSAGPFKTWTKPGRIPLRLFVRQSMQKYVEANELLNLAENAITFFEKQFTTPYPYKKLDLVVVPNFAAGAMENLAAITFSEDALVFRSPQTPSKYLDRANIIAHETAHMWFGDLVTMKWWNGLWLNESFATIMEILASASIDKFKESAWPSFYANDKRTAYLKDQLTTTHPIEVSVHDTDEARSNFDAITYSKGASVLKQLRFFLTPEKFNLGLSQYFNIYGFSNTTLADFMTTVGLAAHQDLKIWQRDWLETAGVNSVEADWSCVDDQLTSFRLFQSASLEQPILRQHRTIIGLYGWDPTHRQLILKTSEPATYQNADTEIPIKSACPVFVFPNYQDQDYAKVLLDGESLKVVRTSLSLVKDAFTRQLLWGTLWDMVRDSKLSVPAYFEIIEKHLPAESESEIIDTVSQRLPSTLIRYTPEKKRAQFHLQIEAFVALQLENSVPSSPTQLIWFQTYLRSGSSPAAQKRIASWLNKSKGLNGIELTQDRRWWLIQSLAKFGYPGVKQLIATELKRDATDSGRKASFLADVLTPDRTTKMLWMNRITRSSINEEDNKLDAGDLRTAANGFRTVDSEQLLEEFDKIYFEQLKRLSGKEDNMYLQRIAAALYPTKCTPALAAKTGAFLKANPTIIPGVRKALKEATQEVEICARIQTTDQR
jgi:aminopeptidase N